MQEYIRRIQGWSGFRVYRVVMEDQVETIV